MCTLYVVHLTDTSWNHCALICLGEMGLNGNIKRFRVINQTAGWPTMPRATYLLIRMKD